MPKKSPVGAPKKARWTPAEKKARAVGPKKPHRGQAGHAGQGGPSTQTVHAGRTSRPASATSAHVGGREWRAPRDERRSFDRSERPERRSFDRAERTDRPSFDRADRADRPSFDRSARPERRSFDRPERTDRPTFDRSERSDRGYSRREDRPGYGRTSDRPERRSFDRSERPDRPERRSFDRSERPTDRPDARRDDRPSFERRDDRTDRGIRREGFGADRFGQDAEAQRLEADTWTKSTRADVSDGPVDVAPDNGFAALGLPERLVERLAREGITTPFPIQVATIPDALAGKDVLGRGQTGSGKTLAFGLPLITRLLEAGTHRAPRRPHALILTPTRELAMQISDALEPLVHVVGLRHKLVAGGLSYTTQINALNKGVDILIATPGRLNDLLERGAVEMDDIAITVIDEADHMAEMGFMAEITTSLEKIPSDGQRLLFSATLDNGIDSLVARYLTDPVTHSTSDATASVEGMDHHVLLIDPQHKKLITAEVANRVGRTLVFCRTKLGADRIALQLREQGVLAAALHGGLNQGARNRVLGAFRDGTLPVLVATDVAARGIHVDDVSVVLQVDPAADHKDYLHRAGRTARAGEKGTVVTLALPHQRRTMERQLKDAGVDTSPVRVAPGDSVISATGATAPSGVPIAEEDFARVLAGPKQQRRAPAGARGPRRGSSGGFRPHHVRGSDDRHDDRRGDRRDDRRDDPRAGHRGARDRGPQLVTRWSNDTTERR